MQPKLQQLWAPGLSTESASSHNELSSELELMALIPNPHKCAGCGRDLDGHHRHCLYCRSKLRKAGKCEWCGLDLPPVAEGGPPPADQRAHIATCREAEDAEIARLNFGDDHFFPRARGTDARENIRETKLGRD